MNRDDALRQIAADGKLDAAALIAYANENHVGGRDTGAWPGMSVFAAEGEMIYALVRALKPRQVVEIGVASGGTTTHILTALEANGSGTLYSVDLDPQAGVSVPAALRQRWTFVTGDALAAPLPEWADFVFEDGEHGFDFTKRMLLRLKTLNPQVILSHDALTHLTYGEAFQVLPAFKEALGTDRTVLTDGSIAGLAYWFNADYQREPVVPVASPARAPRKAGKRG